MSLRIFAIMMSLLVGLLAGASHRLGTHLEGTQQLPDTLTRMSSVEEAPQQQSEQAVPSPIRVILPSPYEVRSN
jgi:hypothetical protein